MAKQTLWQRIKGFFSGKKEQPAKKSSTPKRTKNEERIEQKNTGGGSFNKRELLNRLTGKDSSEKETRYKSMADAINTSNNRSRDFVKTSPPKTKTAIEDPKIDAAKKSRAEMRKKLDAKKQENKEWHEATNNRFNVGEKGISDEGRKRRRQNVKSQTYDEKTAVKEAEHQMKWHGKEMSFARGALSGATFGASDLAAKKLTKGEAKKAEEVYQANKSKGWETAGEIAGSLASFGATAGATEKAAAKIGSKVAPKAAEKLAESQIIKSAAKRSVNKAVKKGLVGEASEELIKQVGKDKAKQITRALGTDIVQNLTTGALYDINRASTEHEVGSSDWWKELGKSAALNFGITGGIAGVSALRGGRQLAVDAAETVANRTRARNSLDSLIKNNSVGEARPTQRIAPRIGESIEDRIARVNAERLGARADDVAENVARNADDVATTSARKVADAADNEAAERLAQIEREMDDAHRVAGDVNATPEERQAAADRFAELNNERERMTSNAPREDGFPYQTTEDDFPVDDINQTRLNDTADEAQARARRVMEEEPISEEAAASRRTAPQAEEAADRELSEGQRQIREEYFKKTGQNIENGKAATDDQMLDALGKYTRSQGESVDRKMSKVAFSQIAVSDKETAEKFLEELERNNEIMDYDVVHHREMYEEVAKDLSEDWDRWVNKICDIAEGGDWSGKESTKLLFMSQYLSEIADATKSPEQDALAKMAWKATQKLATTSAQTMNGRRAYAHMSKASKMECALDDMASILDSAIGFNQQHRKALVGKNRFERENYIKGELLKDTKLRECIKKLVNAKNEDAISEAYAEMLVQFNKSNPKSGFDVLQELRYLNMLGNPKTHLRNVFGSGFFAPMRQVSNAIRAGIEGSISKRTGLEVTKHGGLSLSAAKEALVKNPKTEAGKAALESLNANKKRILGSAKYETPKYAGRGKTLTGKIVDTLADFNSYLLTREDDIFKSGAYRENYIKSYNRYLKDGKPITDKVKKQIEAEALREAEIATFNEYNEFAKMLNSITRKAGDANASAGQRWLGRGVNAVMPFTKVPANLMNQSVNYSPIGIARGMAGIKNAAKAGDAVKLNKAIDELSSGLTGSLVFGLGMLLGKTTDMFTTNTGKNDPAAKFKKDRGMQNYSVTFKDPETGQGYSFTLDWLVPTSATFFSGVELANQLKRGEGGLSFLTDWSTVVSRLAEPVMETSMLSGLHGMLETMRNGSGGDDTKGAIDILIRETVQSYLNSFVPTVLGQAARTAYKTDMQIAGDTDWEYWRNQMKSKAGLANAGIEGDSRLAKIVGEPLGADTDAYGNVKGEKNSTEDYVKSGLKNFLSPANIQKVDFSEVDNEKLRTYEEAVKNGKDPQDMAYLFPKKQYKKQFSVGGDDVKMTNRELSTYNQAKTTGGQEGMRYILENYMFNHQELDAKGKKVPSADAYTKAEKERLIKQFEGKSMREVEQWLYEQPEFKNATEAERRKAIKGLWDLSKDTKTVASQRVGEQAVWKAQGKDVNEYNFKNEITEKKRDALQPYVDAGIITYDEAVDFARNAGKTYYSETDDGGSSSTYYNKKEMIEYLTKKGYSYEKAEALFNSFKQSNAKPYNGNSLSSGRGYRRRGYGGYRRRGGGGSKATVPKIDAKSMASSVKKATATKVKLEPPTPNSTKVAAPKPKFKKYEV